MILGAQFQETELAQHFRETFYSAFFDPAALDIIERNADRILGEMGVRIDDTDSHDLLVRIGGKSDGNRIYLDGGILRRIIRAAAPARFRICARNPMRDVVIGAGERPMFAPIYGAPDVLLTDGKRVKGTREIYRQLVEVVHGTNGLNSTGHMICVMDDVAETDRPWAMLHAHLTLSDKPFMGSIASPEITSEFISLTKAALDREPEPGRCNLVHLINCSPPLTYWENPLRCLRRIAEAGEAAMVSSYMMMGATSPVTVLGALTQGYAEVLVGLALAQLWRPGTPVILGILGWPFDMRSMVPNFGDPASALVQYIAGELARRLGIPARGDGAVTSAKVDDAQAASEGAKNLAAAVGSGASFVLHAAGWLEHGRCVSFEKLRRDAFAISVGQFGEEMESREPEPLDPLIESEIRQRAHVDRI